MSVRRTTATAASWAGRGDRFAAESLRPQAAALGWKQSSGPRGYRLREPVGECSIESQNPLVVHTKHDRPLDAICRAVLPSRHCRDALAWRVHARPSVRLGARVRMVGNTNPRHPRLLRPLGSRLFVTTPRFTVEPEDSIEAIRERVQEAVVRPLTDDELHALQHSPFEG